MSNNCSLGCFKIGSSISMANGILKNIQDISVEDKIVSKDGFAFVYSKVNKVTKKIFNKSIKIKVSDNRECEVTQDHLFYGFKEKDKPTGEQNYVLLNDDLLPYKKWLLAIDLSVGDYLSMVYKKEISKRIGLPSPHWIYSFNELQITSIEEGPGGDFYEIEVENPYNYIANGFVSHNCNLLSQY